MAASTLRGGNPRSTALMPSPPPLPVPLPPWVVLSRVHKDDDVPEGAAFLLAPVAPPCVTRLTLSAAMFPGTISVPPSIVAADDSGRRLLVVTGGSSSSSRIPTLQEGDTLNCPATPSTPPTTTDAASPSSAPDPLPSPASAHCKAIVCDLTTNEALWLPTDGVDIAEAGNVGIISAGGGELFIVAELLFHADNNPRATCTVRRYRSDTQRWTTTVLAHPQPARPHRIDRVFSHGSRLWWACFASGIFNMNPFVRQPVLQFVPVPVGYAMDSRSTELVEESRWLGVCNNNVKFVVMVHDQSLGYMIETWKLSNGVTGYWQPEFSILLEDIWAHPTYITSKLPETKPAVSFVHPLETDMLYFTVDRHVFSVNLRLQTLKDYLLDALSIPEVGYPGLLLAWPLSRHTSVLRIDAPGHRLIYIVRQCLDTLHSIRQDGESAYHLGIQLSTLGADLSGLKHKLNEASKYISQALQYLEMVGPSLGDTPVAMLVRSCIALLKYLSQSMGTTGGVLAFGASAFSHMGLLLQGRHPYAQSGAKQSRRIRHIFTVRNLEEADAIISEWRSTGKLVLADVEEDTGREEATEIYNRFLNAGAYDLIMDSTILLSKLEISDESEWQIA